MKDKKFYRFTKVGLGIVAGGTILAACNGDLAPNASLKDEPSVNTFSTQSASRPITKTYYENNWGGYRTIYALTDGASPRAYLTARDRFSGKCWPAKGRVHSMVFIPSTKLSSSLKATLGVEASRAGLGGSGFAEYTSQTSTTKPAVYRYSTYDPLATGFHYNVVVNNAYNTQKFQTGWLPDSWAGGCGYNVF